MYHTYNRLLSFASIHHAIRGEKLILAAGIKVVALPTPREIGISCGECLLFMESDQQEIMDTLAIHEVYWTKLFQCNMARRIYEEMESR